ncbi:MAG TPA: hypothetical protein VIJ51_05990 [Solirubrobacteraceae bacterium]
MSETSSRPRLCGRDALLSVVVLLLLGASPAVARAAGPTAIGQDAQGTSYVGFATGGQVERVDANGNVLSSWGTPGSAAGQLGGVVAISVAPTGNVWILDTNDRVQQFTPAGSYVSGTTLPACGGGGTPDPLSRGGLDVTATQIFVAHPCADQVIRMNLDFSSPATLSLAAHPKGISVGAAQNGHPALLYVAEPTAARVETFDAQSLALVHSQPVSGTPTDVFTDIYGQLVIADSTSDTVSFYDTNNSYSPYRTLGRPGSAAGSLNQPLAFDVHAQDGTGLSGGLFIADYGNARIQRWDAYGTTIWTAAASAPAGPSVPTDTAPPAISGTPTQGSSVTCSTGTWTGSPTSYAYAWDRDGVAITGATSASYTIQAADVGHQLTCVVVATNGAGHSQPASSAAVVPTGPASCPATVGVSVNAAATYTNSTAVTLTIKAPGGATSVVVANDGGFGGARTFTVAANCQYAWTLTSSGSERLPKTVYVRFAGSGIDANQTFTDDIILDQTAPQVKSATLSPTTGGSPSAKTASVASARARYVLRVHATDDSSGVAKLQLAGSPTAKHRVTLTYRARTTLSSLAGARWIRAVDRAGNYGRWKRVTID